MPPSSMKVGLVFRIWDTTVEPAEFKYNIIIGINSEHVGTIYINTKTSYGELTKGAQASNFLIEQSDYEFLKRDSFADCTTIIKRVKSEVNNLLQGSAVSCVSELAPKVISGILDTIKRSKDLTRAEKLVFGLT